jgi:acyl-CoA synthetase (AMP-forming)/AMP-acid ligase II
LTSQRLPAGSAALVHLFDTILAESPNAEVVVEGDSRLTFAGWWQQSAIAASGLVAAGVGTGDVVCLMLPSSAEFAVCYLAAMRRGAIVTAVNPRLGSNEIAHILTKVDPKLVVTEGPARIPAGLAVTMRTPAELTRESEPTEGFVATAADAPAVIVWTTGTTGMPKGAWFDHESLQLIARNIGPLSAPGDRKLMPVPFAHTGYLTRVYDQLTYRAALILTPREWTARSMLDLLVRERVTVGQGVPTQWEKLITLDELDSADLSRLRLVSTGASRVPPSLVTAMRERLGCPVVVRYASTELPLAFGTGLDDPAEIVSTTVGRPLGDVEVQIRTDAGVTLPVGASGRICLRSRASMRGYWQDPGRTAETMTPDGWITTSDEGSLDSAGNLTIIGRTDDAYIRGGYNVHPSEVERALLAHPRIQRAAVVGSPAPVIGELGVAFVVAAGGGPVPPTDEIRAWCRNRIADYKAPDLVVPVEDLPVNATYKVDRTELRRLAAAAVAQQPGRPRSAHQQATPTSA